MLRCIRHPMPHAAPGNTIKKSKVVETWPLGYDPFANTRVSEDVAQHVIVGHRHSRCCWCWRQSLLVSHVAVVDVIAAGICTRRACHRVAEAGRVRNVERHRRKEVPCPGTREPQQEHAEEDGDLVC